MKCAAESSRVRLISALLIRKRCALTARGSSTPEERVSPQFICGVQLRRRREICEPEHMVRTTDIFSCNTL